MDSILQFLAQWGWLIGGILTALMVVTGLIIKATPNKTDDGVWLVLEPLLSKLAGWVGGQSKDKDEAPSAPSLPGSDDAAEGGLPMDDRSEDSKPRSLDLR